MKSTHLTQGAHTGVYVYQNGGLCPTLFTITLNVNSIHTPTKWQRFQAVCQWLLPVIQATQEAEIRRISVQREPGQILPETLS
jgi:hypothetical protein